MPRRISKNRFLSLSMVMVALFLMVSGAASRRMSMAIESVVGHSAHASSSHHGHRAGLPNTNPAAEISKGTAPHPESITVLPAPMIPASWFLQLHLGCEGIQRGLSRALGGWLSLQAESVRLQV